MATSGVTEVLLSGVHSVTHLVYASSYLNHLLAIGVGRVRVVVVGTGPSLGAPPVRDDTVRSLLPHDPRLSVEFGSGAGDPRWRTLSPRPVLLSIGAPGTRAYARLLATQRRRPYVVVVDEGIGSYGTFLTRRSAYRRQGGGPFRATLRALVVAAGSRLLPDEHWSLYRESETGWVVDGRIAATFRSKVDGARPPAGTAVYLTQPWPELGVLTYEQYAAHLVSVREACERAGLAFVVRLHPWDRPERYRQFVVDPGSGPAEFDRSVVDADVVLGANSTALLNVAAIHGSRVVRMTDPGLAGLDAALGARQRRLLDAFLPPALLPGQLTPARLLH